MCRFRHFFAVLLTIWTVQAFAADPLAISDQRNAFTVSYGIYGGGLQALAADLKLAFEEKQYKAGMIVRPFGVIKRLVPWSGYYITEGTVKGRNLVPVRHDRTNIWRKEKSHVITTYEGDKLVKQEEVEDVNGKSVVKIIENPAEFSDGTVDVMTAILNMLIKTADKDNCTFAQDAYDGKRRFRMEFKDEGTQIIPPSAINVFSGRARLCRMEIVPLMGFTGKPRGYYRVQEEARTKGDLPVVWLGPAWDGGPIIPVRIMFKINYGVVLLNLKAVKH